MRGRKPNSVRIAGQRQPAERTNLSPVHTPTRPATQDLPTYIQATSHDLPSPADNRQQSLSELQAVQTLPEIPTLEVYQPKLETIESVDDDAVDKKASPDQKATSEQVELGKGSSDEQAENKVEVQIESSKGSLDGEVIIESVQEHPNQSIDFAREVRCGTSTPIENVPTVTNDASQTFDPNATESELVTLETVEIELSVEEDKTEL